MIMMIDVDPLCFSIELIDDDYDANKAMVLKWIENIPAAKLSIVSCSVLHC